MASRLSQDTFEAVINAVNFGARASQAAIEVVVNPTSFGVRQSQDAIELVLGAEYFGVRRSQDAVEVVLQFSTRCSQIVLEQIRVNPDPPEKYSLTLTVE